MVEVAVNKSFKENNRHFKYNFKSNTDRIVLFGPSGSGKSNLIKMIVGFMDPDEGTIKINNNTFFSDNKKKKLPIYKRRVGYLPQEYTLFPHMTVEENILYGTKINKIKINQDNYYSLLEKLELIHKLNLYPNQLSGGEKQRVAFARAILVNPDILLFDEPFSSLDKVIKDKLRDTVIDIIDETGKKAIFVTHDFEDAFILGKEVFVINNGKIIENGTANDIFNNPQFVETAKILNIKNIWKAKEFKKLFNNIHISAPFVGIKSENILINPKNTDFKIKGSPTKIRKKGTITEIEFLINNIRFISITPETNISENEIIEIGFSKDNLLFLKELENESFSSNQRKIQKNYHWK